MAEHFKALSAVFPIIINKKNEVLLAKRKNTGYMDGKWDFAGSGHVDEEETAIQAVIRESKEEIDIDIVSHDVEFAYLSHRVGKNGNRTYYCIYFKINSFCGVPAITESDKCSALEWFSFESLPQNMIDIHKTALINIFIGQMYHEIIIE